MANFSDTALKQVVDDLNALNGDTLPQLLSMSQCQLLNPVPDDTQRPVDPVPGFCNTRATLRILTPSVGIPAGDLTVHYRRLDLAVLYASLSPEVNFEGEALQTVDMQQIVTRLENGLGSGLADEMSTTPINITRTPQGLVIEAPVGSLKFIGSFAINVQTAKINLANLPVRVVTPWSSAYPQPGEVVQEKVLTSIQTSNVGYYVPLPDMLVSDFDVGPTVDSNDTPYSRDFQLTAKVDNPYYTGTQLFTYTPRLLTDAFLQYLGSINPSVTYSGEWERVNGWLSSFFTANTLLDDSINSTRNTLLPLRRQATAAYVTMAGQFPAWHADKARVDFTDTRLWPFECIVEFTIESPVSGLILYNYSTEVAYRETITIELLSKPAEFAPTNFTLGLIYGDCYRIADTLAPGTYRVRATAPDSAKSTLGSFNMFFRWGADVAAASVPINRLIKLKTYDARQMFYAYEYAGWPSKLATIDAGALDESFYLMYTHEMFKECTALTSIPVGLLDNCKKLGGTNMFGMFKDCTSLTTIPDAFINGQEPDSQGALFSYLVSNTSSNGVFAGTGITSVTKNMFQNLQYWRSPNELFGGITGLTSVPADLLENFTNPEDDALFQGLFAHSGLTSVPATIFDSVLNARPANSGTISFDWTFVMSDLESIPPTLFSAVNGRWAQFGFTFAGTKITSIPVELFDNVGFGTPSEFEFSQPQTMYGTFYQCSLLTSVPETLFTRGGKLLSGNVNRIFMESGLTSIPAGLFANSNIWSFTEAFSGCPSITSVPATLFTASAANLTKTRDFNSVFQNTPLSSIPEPLFSGMTKVRTFELAFSGNTSIISVPPNLFLSNIEVTNMASTFQGCTGLMNVPTGLFAANTEVTTFVATFKGCTLITSIPASLFANNLKVTAYTEAFAGTGLTTLPTSLFGANAIAVSLISMFESSQMSVVPNDVFYPLSNVTGIGAMFGNCANLTSVGRLIYRTTTGFLGTQNLFGHTGSDSGSGQPDLPNFTVADNVIDGSVSFTLTNMSVGGMFNRRPTMNKDITNLLGANVRIDSFNAAMFKSDPNTATSGIAIQGSGAAFIAKHSVNTGNTGFFRGCTSLSDYGSLPAWAL